MERLLETVKMSFSNPERMFSNLPAEDIGPPVLYGVIIGSIALVMGLVWQLLFSGMAWFWSAEFEQVAVSTTIIVVFMIFSPLLVAVGLFISAGIYHVMLLLCGDGSRGFGVTMRAVSYGYTPNLLSVVPFCGGLVGGIWALVLTIMGAMYGHRTEPWRAILAYFLPLILCCCLILGLGMIFGFFGAMAE